MGTILDYSMPPPTERRLSWRTAVVGGILAGIITFGSVFVVGFILYLGVGLLAGIVLSAISARASPGYEFRAGFVASGFAALAAFSCGTLLAPLLLGTSPLWSNPIFALLVLVFWWALFALPGMLGTLWFWEGRRRRNSYQDPPIG